MMSGWVDTPSQARPSTTRRYAVIARAGGWSISVNGACTRPFRSRHAAERIAKTLQRQADALTTVRMPRCATTPERPRAGAPI